jgi:hypothetical protein
VSDTRCHIAPEPIEAPEPQREERQRDLVREEALRLGCIAAHINPETWCAHTVTSFRAGVEAYEAHLSRHDYRGRR